MTRQEVRCWAGATQMREKRLGAGARTILKKVDLRHDKGSSFSAFAKTTTTTMAKAVSDRFWYLGLNTEILTITRHRLYISITNEYSANGPSTSSAQKSRSKRQYKNV